MSAMIFDGKAFAATKEKELHTQVEKLKAKGIAPYIKTITFVEDDGSRLYTKIKKTVANNIGIRFEPIEYSILDPVQHVIDDIYRFSHDSWVTGVMVQKPSKAVWMDVTGKGDDDFSSWWDSLTAVIDPAKDVDCLTQKNLDSISPASTLLPATVSACLTILKEARKRLQISQDKWKAKHVLVIGRSPIVGKPLTRVLRGTFTTVTNLGSVEFSDLVSQTKTNQFDIIISAVGKPNLITGYLVKEDVILIDVGAPQGDMERDSLEKKAAFLTPVPGGVGPVTVISLMENIVTLAR